MNGTKIMVMTVCGLAVAVLFAAGGQDKIEQARIERGIDYAKANLEKLGRDKVSTLAFMSTIEQGGSVVSFLVNGIREPGEFPRFAMEKPAEPWTVVIKAGKDTSEFILEGYGTDLVKPQITVIVKSALPSNPAPAMQAADAGSSDPPLTIAAAEGKLDEVKALLAKGANVDAMSVEGATALMYASTQGHAEVVKTLLAAGADMKIPAKNRERWPALMFAVKGGSGEIVRLLLDKGADPNAKDAFNNSPLMLAAMDGKTAILELLSKSGAKLDEAVLKSGNTALLLALSKKHRDTALTLMKAGADVNRADSMGVTPLMMASGLGEVDSVRDLLERKADVNAKMSAGDRAGATALMQAAGKGNAQIVKLLLDAGASRDVKDARGNDARRYAEFNNRQDVTALLDTALPAPTPAAQALQPAAAQPAVQPATAVQPAAPSSDTLVGKTQQDADAVFGRSVGKMTKGGKTTVFYQNGEVELQNGKITSVSKK